MAVHEHAFSVEKILCFCIYKIIIIKKNNYCIPRNRLHTLVENPVALRIMGVFCICGFQVVHHTLSAIAVGYAMFTGEGQLYTFMVLISELTTPEINLRWYV